MARALSPTAGEEAHRAALRTLPGPLCRGFPDAAPTGYLPVRFPVRAQEESRFADLVEAGEDPLACFGSRHRVALRSAGIAALALVASSVFLLPLARSSRLRTSVDATRASRLQATPPYGPSVDGEEELPPLNSSPSDAAAAQPPAATMSPLERQQRADALVQRLSSGASPEAADRARAAAVAAADAVAKYQALQDAQTKLEAAAKAAEAADAAAQAALAAAVALAGPAAGGAGGLPLAPAPTTDGSSGSPGAAAGLAEEEEEEEDTLPAGLRSAYCTEGSADCSMTQCCKDTTKKCFEKGHGFAMCLPSCVPGIHADEAAGLQAPWTCRPLRPVTPPAVKNKITAPTSYLSLFCWALASAVGGELDLLQMQYTRAAGIFGCDDYMVFCDEKQDIPNSFELTNLAERKNVAGALTATWVNAEEFITAWERVVNEGRFANHDWTLKADPDAVLLASGLRKHLSNFESQAANPAGCYLKNCQAGPRGLQLFGSVELLSLRAVQTFGSNRERCRNEVEHSLMGEDNWLQKCLDLAGVVPVEDYDFLADGYCPSSPPIDVCSPARFAFHPFKMPLQWLKCWEEANRP